MKMRRAIATLAAGLLLLVPSISSACDCLKTPADQVIAKADIAFEGRAVEAKAAEVGADGLPD